MSKQAQRNQNLVKTAEYQRNGGVVLAMPESNRQAKKIRPAPPKRGPDELCKGCNHIGTCRTPCKPIAWIDGKNARKENLLKDPLSYPNQSSDYNEVLSHIIEAKERNYTSDVRAIEDMRLRAIAALLYADIPIPRISQLLHYSRSQLYRIIWDAKNAHKHNNITKL